MLCRHQYGWPRRVDGVDVQTCTRCGATKKSKIQFRSIDVWERTEAEVFGFDPSIQPELQRALVLVEDPSHITRIGATRTRIRPQRVRGTYNVDDWHVWARAWQVLDQLIGEGAQ